MNFIPSRFTTTNFDIPSLQPRPLSTTTDFMECPNLPQSDTTIISGVQIVTNDDPPSLNSPPQEEFTENNWLPPLYPQYSYDSPPKMPIYKKSKKKGQTNNNDVDDTNSSTIRPKRNYTKKPLDRLKRPRNGYMIYMNEVYDDVKRNHPHLKFGELSTQIGIQWKKLTKAEQMPYHQKHEEEKNAYESAKLAMSRTNLQIVEETIGIERQVKAAELKAFELIAAKNKKDNKVEIKVEETRQLSQSETPSSRYQPPPNYREVAPCIPTPGNSVLIGSNVKIEQKVINSHYPKGNNVSRHNEKPPTRNEPRKSDVAPSTVLRKLKPKPDIPTSPVFINRALQLTTPQTLSLPIFTPENARSIRRNTVNSPAREAQRVKYFKQHFPDLNVQDERKNERAFVNLSECKGESIPQSVVEVVDKDVSRSDTDEMKIFETDDDEEEIDQLLPSDQSDTEMEGIEISSSTCKSPDTSTMWYLPIGGTIVSPGLTPFRKRKVIRTEEPEEVVVEPKRFKEKE
ncbi:1456_t:CDS:2 [Funneliformis geosporum]|uniref:4571_t:CDS:1 n=1 Tax=Funneliformis geosporum TaxID=1117311 RepID=A0A9W4SGT1_9GLOM|nr:1456_t:CDS:2 [Funneliformis geosporum]CAI2167984.1 4571_t:CDS:2 [Funneliformis geosporum]